MPHSPFCAAFGQVQIKWPQTSYSSEKLGKGLFIVAGFLKICVVGLFSCTPTCPLWIKWKWMRFGTGHFCEEGGLLNSPPSVRPSVHFVSKKKKNYAYAENNAGKNIILYVVMPIHVFAYFMKNTIMLSRWGTLELRVHWFTLIVTPGGHFFALAHKCISLCYSK